MLVNIFVSNALRSAIISIINVNTFIIAHGFILTIFRYHLLVSTNLETIMNINALSRQLVARQLHEYMQYRAREEDQEYGLNEKFFRKGLKMNPAEIFGISYDRDGLVADNQQPGLFAIWKNAPKVT